MAQRARSAGDQCHGHGLARGEGGNACKQAAQDSAGQHARKPGSPAEALADPSMILAPADGRVVAIVETEENTFIKGKATQISIFLSPLDAHVNRSPASGIIKYFKYLPGDYIVAYHPKSSIKNEQTHIGLENNAGKVFFKQIVGILARRLVWDIKEGDTISAGQKFGMMKFGSRMDVFVPQESTVFLKKGQRVIAGETIMARLK